MSRPPRFGRDKRDPPIGSTPFAAGSIVVFFHRKGAGGGGNKNRRGSGSIVDVCLRGRLRRLAAVSSLKSNDRAGKSVRCERKPRRKDQGRLRRRRQSVPWSAILLFRMRGDFSRTSRAMPCHGRLDFHGARISPAGENGVDFESVFSPQKPEMRNLSPGKFKRQI